MPLLCLLFPPFQLLVAYIPDVSGEQESGRCIGSCSQLGAPGLAAPIYLTFVTVRWKKYL